MPPPIPLRITSVKAQPAGQLELQFESPTPGQTHLIQETLDLGNPSWTTVAGVTFGAPAGQTLTAQFPMPTATRFYRVQIQP